MVGKRAVLLAGVLLGTLFLYLAARSIDLAVLAATLRRAHVADLVGVVACTFLYLALKAHRWRYLVSPLANATTRGLLPAVCAGNAGNLLFPHFGEVFRAILAGRSLEVPPTALLATVAVERICDFLVLLLIAWATLAPIGRMSPDMLVASYAIGGLSVVALIAALAFLLRTEACLGLLAWVLAPLSPRAREAVLRQVRAGVTGLNSISRPDLFLPVLLYSVLQWLAVLACVAFSLRAVDIQASLAAAVSALLLNVIGLVLPAAPGNVGTTQLAFTMSLEHFGVARADAFAASVVYNVLMAATTLALGVPSFRKAGTFISEL